MKRNNRPQGRFSEFNRTNKALILRFNCKIRMKMSLMKLRLKK